MTVPVAILTGLLCGAVLGGLFVYAILRFQAGGQSGAAVRKELEQYRSDVGDHFDKTSELFADMTDQYRSLYEHLSTDARNLTGRDSIADALEASRAVLPDLHADGQLEDKRSGEETYTADDPAAVDAGQLADTDTDVIDDGVELPASVPEPETPTPGSDALGDGAANQPAMDDAPEETPESTNRS